MKDRVLASVILIAICTAVLVNTLVLQNKIIEVIKEVSTLDTAAENAKDRAKSIYEEFKHKETYISLTVNHNDLTNIEECFAEMIGYLEAEDKNGALATKSRLIDSLEHLKRLSGLNIDAVI